MNDKTNSVNIRSPEDAKAKKLLGVVTDMKGERRANEPYYFKAALLFDAREAEFWCSDDASRKKLKSNSDVYSGVGRNSIRRNTNFFMSNATPETGVWWRARTVNQALMQVNEVSDWLRDVSRKVQAQQRESLYIALRQCYRQMFISYGVIYQGIRRDRGKRDRSVFYEHVPSHSIWYRKNIYGRIFQAAWERVLTIDAFFEAYGEYPEKFKSEASRKGKGNNTVKVTIFVARSHDFKEKPKKASEHEYVEHHIAEKRVVDTRGYTYMPFEEIKLDDSPNSDYPVGIAYDALPDARSANQARKAQLKALAYAAQPPILASSRDAITSYGKQLVPGGFIEEGLNHNGKPNFVPLNGMFNPEILTYAVADDEMRVRDTFMQNELVQTHSDELTATAARIIAGERAAMVAPFVNSIMPALTRLCENHIRILAESGELPPAPASVSGEDFDIDIVSPMAMQARSYEAAALVEAISYVAQVAQIDQSALAAFDTEDALKIIASATGMEGVIDLEKMKRSVKQAQAAAQVEQMAAMQMADAEIANSQADVLGKVTAQNER